MSDPLAEEIQENKTWKTFEWNSVETEMQTTSSSNIHFVPMKIEENGNSDFAFFEGYEEKQKVQINSEEQLKEIEKTAEIREQEGYEKGFEQGEKDGLELGEKKSKKMLEKIEMLFESISRSKSDMLKMNEKDILDIIFKIAEKITQIQLGLNNTSVRKTIIEAIQYATEKSHIVLRINPEDFNFVEKLRPELFERFKMLKSIIVNSDSTIEKGGCYLETLSGDIDARIETQIEKIADSIKNAFTGSMDG